MIRKFTGSKIKYPVKASTTIAKDDLVAIDTDGYAIPATDTSGLKFVGVCGKGVVNSGANGAKEVEVYRTGVISMAATSITQAMVGSAMYVVDKNTFDNTSSNLISCGTLVKYISNTVGWIYIGLGGVAKAASAVGAHTTSREENVAGLSSAIALATELRTDLISHFAKANRHTTGLQSTASFTGVPTTLAELIALTNLMQTAYAAHNADVIKASAWEYHNAQDTTHALADATAVTTLQTAITKLNDMKTKYNAHELETTGHAGVGTVTADQIAAAAAAYGAAIKVADGLVKSGDLIYWSIVDDGTGNVTGVSAVAGDAYVTFTFNADPQNDAIISYEAIRL